MSNTGLYPLRHRRVCPNGNACPVQAHNPDNPNAGSASTSSVLELCLNTLESHQNDKHALVQVLLVPPPLEPPPSLS